MNLLCHYRGREGGRGRRDGGWGREGRDDCYTYCNGYVQ